MITPIILGGVSFIPLFSGAIVDEFEVGILASIALLIYTGLSTRQPLMLGLALFILVVVALYIGINTSGEVGVGDSA